MNTDDLIQTIRRLQRQTIHIEGNVEYEEQILHSPQIVSPHVVSSTAKVDATTLTVELEEMQRLVKEIGPPPPHGPVKLNSRITGRLCAIIPSVASSPHFAPLFCVEIEIDDTLPDHVMKIGEDLHSTKRETIDNG